MGDPFPEEEVEEFLDASVAVGERCLEELQEVGPSLVEVLSLEANPSQEEPPFLVVDPFLAGTMVAEAAGCSLLRHPFVWV